MRFRPTLGKPSVYLDSFFEIGFHHRSLCEESACRGLVKSTTGLHNDWRSDSLLPLCAEKQDENRYKGNKNGSDACCSSAVFWLYCQHRSARFMLI
jgi:hypothetical protein